jgi:cell division protease FtsH
MGPNRSSIDPRRKAASGGGSENDPKRSFGRRHVLIFLALLVVNYVIVSLVYEAVAEPRVEIPYRPTFVEQVEAGNVVSITSKGVAIDGVFERAVRFPGDAESAAKNFSTVIPEFADADELDALLLDNGVEVKAEPAGTGSPLWLSLLTYVVPALLFFGFLIWYMRKAGAASGGGLFGMGRARAKQYEPTKERVTFADVAGIDEVEQELAEVVDFLKNPAKYQRLGARVPRGVLLSGAPGTGKTLLARAVAGEAGVPFFSMSASEFIEMVVGVGASRVRDLFDQAKKAAPSIIFIDEIDAIGRSRGAGTYGGNDEREQTLNQILTEMDGFDVSTGVVVLAATNRPDVLDSALLRPGRFDRRITIQAPDRDGRLQILRVHTRSVPLADGVNLEGLASTTVGMVGADLANLVNEAALMAARHGHERVEMSDFTDALERIILGTARKLTLSSEDRRRIAYHEAGHAITGMLTPGADPVRKISIIPRTMSLGVTVSAPETDRFNYEKDELVARIMVTTGGRAAEELVFGDATTGAENDIRQATALARNMVGRFGMSDSIGFVAVLPQDGQTWPGYSEVSEGTRRQVDEEVKRIIEEAHADTLRLLNENRGRLEALAEALVETETLEGPDAYRAAGLEPPAAASQPTPPRAAALAEPVPAS